jgi:single-strand DNA-binding protein
LPQLRAFIYREKKFFASFLAPIAHHRTIVRWPSERDTAPPFSFSANPAVNSVSVSIGRSQTVSTRAKNFLLRRASPVKGVVMNSFTVTAVGNLAKDPELAIKGDTTYTRLCLVGNDYAGKDERGNVREAVTTVWFVAFESLGEAIAKHARKGDQLILQAQIRSNNWTDKDGEKQYDHSFVVQNFRFGAPGKVKREELASRRDERDIGALEAEV